MIARRLDEKRVDEVLALLGFVDRPTLDFEGLHAVYSAWCRLIPFDNLQKLVALHADNPVLPGIEPDDFFATWEVHGTGGTCWATNNALHALLAALGFDAATWSASMFDGPANHGTTIVSIDDRRWLVDTAIHGDVPAPIIDGDTTTVSHAGYPTTVRADTKGHLFDHPTPDPTFVIPCRILDPIDHDESAAANERSRGWSPFNSDLMAAINDATGVWMLKDDQLARINMEGTSTWTLTTDETDEFLIDIVGCSPQIVSQVRSTL